MVSCISCTCSLGFASSSFFFFGGGGGVGGGGGGGGGGWGGVTKTCRNKKENKTESCYMYLEYGNLLDVFFQSRPKRMLDINQLNGIRNNPFFSPISVSEKNGTNYYYQGPISREKNVLIGLFFCTPLFFAPSLFTANLLTCTAKYTKKLNASGRIIKTSLRIKLFSVECSRVAFP